MTSRARLLSHMPEEAELVRSVLTTLPVPVVVSRIEDGLVMYANEPAAHAFGITLDAFVGSKTHDLYVDPSEWGRIVHIIERDGRLENYEVLLRGPGAAPFWALASSSPLSYEGEAAMCATFQDITARKQVEQTVRAASEFAEELLATVREPVIALGSDLRVVTANRAFCLAFAVSNEQVVGQHLRDVLAGASHVPELERRISELWAGGGSVTSVELAVQSPVLGARTMLLNARRLYRPGSDSRMILMSLQDVTAFKREHEQLVAAAASAQRVAEVRTARLAETERRLFTILRNMPGIAYRCRNDDTWTMEFLSEGSLALTGYTPGEMLGNGRYSYADLIVEDDRERVRQALAAGVASRQPFQMEYRIRTKHGETKWVWEQGIAVADPPGCGEVQAIEGIIHDITARRTAEHEREEMETRMRAVQRMEAVGRLAGGVAHDFNNLLTVIQSYATFLEEQFRPDDPARDDVEMIKRAAHSATRLTSQLLAFSRRQVQKLEVVELGAVLADLHKMLGRVLGEHIELVIVPGRGHGKVRVDVGQLEQVIVNLAVNARDAMPSGGRLTIETRRVELDGSHSAAKEVRIEPGSYVMLSVSDTGIGMDEETQSRLFEPFFTTKEQGKGTGLGLSTVYGIVKQSGGYIWVYSQPGAGSMFEIYLPETTDALSESTRLPAVVASRGAETVLLVEDEELVRKAASRSLRRHGYRVLEAAHGGEAVLLCEQFHGPIDLLITDVVMPWLSGKDVADRAISIRPDLRVLYMSGYTDDTIVHRGVLQDGVAFLQKPFSEEALVRKVRETLDR